MVTFILQRCVSFAALFRNDIPDAHLVWLFRLCIVALLIVDIKKAQHRAALKNACSVAKQVNIFPNRSMHNKACIFTKIKIQTSTWKNYLLVSHKIVYHKLFEKSRDFRIENTGFEWTSKIFRFCLFQMGEVSFE